MKEECFLMKKFCSEWMLDLEFKGAVYFKDRVYEHICLIYLFKQADSQLVL